MKNNLIFFRIGKILNLTKKQAFIFYDELPAFLFIWVLSQPLLLFIFHSLLFLFAYRLFRFLLEQVVLQQKIDYHQQKKTFLNLLEFLRNQLSRNLTHLRVFCAYIVIPFRVYY